METISKVSKGTKMDQIYLSKNRTGLSIGQYVLITPLKTNEENKPNPFFYNIKNLEKIKVQIINEILEKLTNELEEIENIIVTGSFLERGFNFQDIDIIILTKKTLNSNKLTKELEDLTNIKVHLILMSKEDFFKGVSTDPLFENMLSKFVSLERIVLNFKRILIPKILDINLLKSKDLIENFDILDGRQKYCLLKNLIAIKLFLELKKISNEKIDSEISKEFKITPENLKKNMISKKDIAQKFNKLYQLTFNKILNKIKNGSK